VNCYIGGQITAYAREVIYDYLSVVEKSFGTIYYVDCDSIIFTLPKETKIPLQISDAVGDFKFQIHGEITNFYSFGTKNYTLTYNEEGVTKISTKIKGLSLEGVKFKQQFTDEIFTNYLFSTKQEEKEIVQLRNKKLPNGSYEKKFQIYTFRNHFSTKRMLKKPNYVSYPFGWTWN
jgi:DNA polymerase elongation subunit (family B)